LRPGGFAWSIAQRGDPTIHGYESEIGIELLSMPEVRDGEYALPVRRLDLPVDPRTFGEAAVLGLDGQRLLVARLTGDDDGRSIRLDPPAPGDRPIILRLS
ncbi:MAG: hypothetical protein R3349_11115, partial [Geminicoccaceae bacterium]|nr:hypothetical protein [Geminicoccaceae bacterium]